MRDFPNQEAAVDQAIQERRTVKVLAETAFPIPAAESSQVAEMLSLAGMAPFHRACDPEHRSGNLNGIEPWRFYVVEAEACRALGPTLDAEKAGKIPKMLAAADALLLCTWLPNTASEEFAESNPNAMFEPTLGNMEHIAAGSSAIQNLLLTATARGIANYWSSGGVLREPDVFQKLGISSREILLGAIFLFPSDTRDATVVESKLRSKRTSASAWSRVVEL